jgi:hypothetical protein
MRRLPPPLFRFLGLIFPVFSLAQTACEPKNALEAENRKDIGWLSENPSGESVAALGRLADQDPRAEKALEARAGQDVNTQIAAWAAVTRNAPWGTAFLKASLADPARAEMASTALPRKDARLVPFVPDLENAVVRLAAGNGGVAIAGLLATIGPQAHAAVERRLLDPKTRGAMCNGINLPDSSGDAKSVLLAVPPEARDNPACVRAVIDMSATEPVVLDWLATGAEPGLVNVAAKSTLACDPLARIWKKALAERPPQTHAALTVPLERSISRCTTALDPVLAELLANAPRARGAIVAAIDPYGNELANLKETCAALKKGYANGESAATRERAREALARGCMLAR